MHKIYFQYNIYLVTDNVLKELNEWKTRNINESYINFYKSRMYFFFNISVYFERLLLTYRNKNEKVYKMLSNNNNWQRNKKNKRSKSY